jgi:hypothetical protein
MQLSPHFTLEEMIASPTALRKGIDNSPSPEIIANLTALCVNILEPLRANFNAPIVITSGFRCPKLNKAIGGSTTSQHCRGQAADFTIPGFTNDHVANFIAQHFNFDQLILEFPPQGWVHCSWAPSGHERKSVLTAVKSGRSTKYIPGIHP